MPSDILRVYQPRGNGQSLLKNLSLEKWWAWGVTIHHVPPIQEFMIRSPWDVTFHRTPYFCPYLLLSRHHWLHPEFGSFLLPSDVICFTWEPCTRWLTPAKDSKLVLQLLSHPSGHHHPLTQNHSLAIHSSLLIFLFLPSSPPAVSAANAPAYLQGTVSSQLLPQSAPHPPQVEPVTYFFLGTILQFPPGCSATSQLVISFVYLYMFHVLPGHKYPNTIYWAIKVNVDLGNFLTSPVKSSAFQGDNTSFSVSIKISWAHLPQSQNHGQTIYFQIVPPLFVSCPSSTNHIMKMFVVQSHSITKTSAKVCSFIHSFVYSCTY